MSVTNHQSPATSHRLYDYWRSSASYRVRIALNLKSIEAEQVSINLAKGAQQEAGYRNVNAQGLVPALVTGDQVLTQSMAILEYLEETHPTPPLLPEDPVDRAQVRAMAMAVACDIHPLNNLRVLKYLVGELEAEETQKLAWYCHWTELGLEALEAMVAPYAGTCCFGDQPTLADICLVPQLYNARRFECDLSSMPKLVEIDAYCRDIPAFAAAAPEQQADAA